MNGKASMKSNGTIIFTKTPMVSQPEKPAICLGEANGVDSRPSQRFSVRLRKKMGGDMTETTGDTLMETNFVGRDED